MFCFNKLSPRSQNQIKGHSFFGALQSPCSSRYIVITILMRLGSASLLSLHTVCKQQPTGYMETDAGHRSPPNSEVLMAINLQARRLGRICPIWVGSTGCRSPSPSACGWEYGHVVRQYIDVRHLGWAHSSNLLGLKHLRIICLFHKGNLLTSIGSLMISSP